MRVYGDCNNGVVGFARLIEPSRRCRALHGREVCGSGCVVAQPRIYNTRRGRWHINRRKRQTFVRVYRLRCTTLRFFKRALMKYIVYTRPCQCKFVGWIVVYIYIYIMHWSKKISELLATKLTILKILYFILSKKSHLY